MTSRWQNKAVLITGGSDGLGWHLARAWGHAGASVGLVARRPGPLQQAVDALRQEGIEVTSHPADVTDRQQVTALATWVEQQFGRLDVLVNAAGRSDRGLAAETTGEQFEALWRLNFLGTVHCSQVLLPYLRQSQGSLVNVGSLAAKIASPFLGAYPASKFPVAAFCQQMRLELAEDHVHVLLVCPGPIARPDSGRRYTQQTQALPDSAGRPGGGARISALSPGKLAQAVLRACEQRRPELVLPARARWLFVVQQLSPSWGDWLVRRFTS